MEGTREVDLCLDELRALTIEAMQTHLFWIILFLLLLLLVLRLLLLLHHLCCKKRQTLQVPQASGTTTWYDVVNVITKALLKLLRWLSFPWIFPAKCCKAPGSGQTMTLRHFVGQSLMFSGFLINTIVLLIALRLFHENPCMPVGLAPPSDEGGAFGLHEWEWLLLAMAAGRFTFGVFFLAPEYCGYSREGITHTFASLFSVTLHAGDLRERNAVRLALTLLSGQAGYFFATYVAMPLEQVGIFSAQFLSAIGGNLATGYGLTKMSLAAAVRAHHAAEVNIPLLQAQEILCRASSQSLPQARVGDAIDMDVLMGD